MTLLLWLASSTGAVADDYPVNPGDCQDSWVCIFSPTIGGTITGPYSLCPGKTGSWSISDTVTPGRKERCEMPKYPGVLNANGDKGKIDWVWKIEGVNSFTADGVGSSFDKSYSEPGEYKITWKGSAYTDDKGESEKCDNPYDVEVTFSFTVNSSTPTAALTSIVIKSDLVCAEESDGISIIGDQSQCDPGSYTVKWKIESDGGSQNLQFTPSSGEVSLTFMQSANITFKVKAGAGAKAGTAQIKITATVNGVDQTMSGAVTVNDPKPKANLSSIFTMPDSICLDEESDGICIISDGSQCDPGAYTVKWKIESDGGSQNLQFTPSSGEVSLTFMQSVNITFKVKAGAGAKAGTATYKLTATVNGVDQTMNGQVTVDDSTATATLSDVRICVPDEQGIMPLEITNTGKCKTTYTWLAYVADGDREVQITPATGTVTLDPQEKSKNLSLTLSYAGKKLIATTIRVDVDTATTSGVANATAIAIGKGLPNDGEAKFDDDLTCLDLPPEGGAAQRIPFTVHHSIITNDTPEARELKGNLSLRVMGGTPASFKIYHGNALYVWGSDIPVVEYGHSGCGRHDFHTGDETFFVEVIGAGMLELEAKVVPVEEKPYGQGAATKKDSIKMFTKEPKKIAVDVVHSSVGVCIGEEFFFPIKLTNNGDCPVTVNLTATKIAGNLLLENNTLEASIQLPPHGEPQVKHLSGKVLDISPPGTAKLHLKVMLGNETIYQTDAGNHLTVFTNSEPNQGVADLPEGARDCLPVNVATDPTKPLSPEISFTINRGIVTTNSLPTRQLNGKLSLSVVSGDQNAVRLFHKGEPYTWGSPIAFSELGGSCGQVENMGTETFSAVGLAPGLIEIEAKVIPDPDQFGAGGSLRTARLKLHAFDLQPYVGAAGNVLETTLLGDIKIEKFSKNGNYVRFLAVDGSTDITVSKADYDQAIQAAEAGGALPDWSGQIVITKQRRSDKSLKLTLLIGDRVSVGWHDALIEGCERLKEYSGGDEAFRVKEALAVVRLGYRTEAGEFVDLIQQSRSIPRVQLNPVSLSNITINGSSAYISIAGQVTDKYAGLVETSVLNRIDVYQTGVLVGSLSFTAVSDSQTEWAPYAKHFTFSGQIPFNLSHGSHGLLIKTNANEMGVQGTANITIEGEADSYPAAYRKTWQLAFTQQPSTTTVDVITATLPDSTPGAPAIVFSATETGADTRVFTANNGYRITLSSVPAWNVGDDDFQDVWIEKNGVTDINAMFNENALDSKIFTLTQSEPLVGPITLPYVIRLPAGQTMDTATTVLLDLPLQLVGPGAPPISLAGSLGNFTGVWSDWPVTATFTGSGSNRNGVIVINGLPVVRAFFPFSGDTSTPTYSASAVFSGSGPNFRATSATAIVETLPADAWQPYQLMAQFPSTMSDQHINSLTWYQNARQVQAFKKDGKYFVGQNQKPAVVVAGGDMPAPIGGTSGDATKAASNAMYSGSVSASSIEVRVKVVADASSFANSPPPATLPFTLVISGNQSETEINSYWDLSVTGVNARQENMTVEANWDQLPPGTYSGTLALAVAEQQPRAFAIKDSNQVFAASQPLIAAGDTFPVWRYWKTDDEASEGWVWNDEDNIAHQSEPITWTAPLDENSTAGNSLTLLEATRLALTGTKTAPTPAQLLGDDGRSIMVREEIIKAFAKTSRELAYLDLEQIKKLYDTLTANFGEITYFVPNGPSEAMADHKLKTLAEAKKFNNHLKLKYTTADSGLDLFAVVAFANEKIKKKNDAVWAAWLAKKEKRQQIVQGAGWTLDPSPAKAMKILTFINVLADPFAWGSVIAGTHEVFKPIEGDVTWTSVAIGVGFLVLDVFPATRVTKMVASAGGKVLNASKLVLRKTGVLPPTKQANLVAVDQKNIKDHCIGGSCFIAGTRVLTDHGWKPIETIRPGDRVHSRDERSGRSGYRLVRNTFVTWNEDLVQIGVRDEASRSQTLTGTTEHPFWTESRGWVPMAGLRYGDRLKSTDGAWLTVDAIDFYRTDASVATYNLTVAEWHTYFVAGLDSARGVWVHNTQQKSCGLNLQKSLGEWNGDMTRFRKGGDLEKLKPHQKFLLAADRNQVRRPGLDRIDLNSVKPPDYNLETEDIWHGTVSFVLKGSGKRIAYKNGFPDFSPYKYKAGPGRKSQVSITPRESRNQDFDDSWSGGGFTPEERAVLEKSYVWHHTTDIANGKIKMQLVEKEVHSLSKTTLGYNHTGGFAIVKWLELNHIPF